MKATLTKKIHFGLLKAGAARVPAKDTRKYLCFSSLTRRGYFYWLGKASGLRHGRISSDSLPVSDRERLALELKWARSTKEEKQKFLQEQS